MRVIFYKIFPLIEFAEKKLDPLYLIGVRIKVRADIFIEE